MILLIILSILHACNCFCPIRSTRWLIIPPLQASSSEKSDSTHLKLYEQFESKKDNKDEEDDEEDDDTVTTDNNIKDDKVDEVVNKNCIQFTHVTTTTSTSTSTSTTTTRSSSSSSSSNGNSIIGMLTPITEDVNITRLELYSLHALGYSISAKNDDYHIITNIVNLENTNTTTTTTTTTTTSEDNTIYKSLIQSLWTQNAS